VQGGARRELARTQGGGATRTGATRAQGAAVVHTVRAAAMQGEAAGTEGHGRL
jgi:hypothetical protein